MAYVYDGEESVMVVGTESDETIATYLSLYTAGNVLLVFVTTAGEIAAQIAEPRCRIGIILQAVEGVNYETLATGKGFHLLFAKDAALHTATGATAILANVGGGDLQKAHERIVLLAQNMQNLIALKAL